MNYQTVIPTLTEMSKIWKKIGNPMPVERLMRPNRNGMENDGYLQPIAPNMKPTLWVLGENISLGLYSIMLGSNWGSNNINKTIMLH